jgi:hypothetical protein
MSLYAMVHGTNDLGPALVQFLQQVYPFEVGRYRDAWVEADGDTLLIRIHTRNGGGNREDYEPENASMQAHPWYVRDADDDFDCTYADFYFKPPLAEIHPDTASTLVELAAPPVDVGARWMEAIDAIRNAPKP